MSEEYELLLALPIAETGSAPYRDFLEELANGEMRRYKAKIQWGHKSGQTYYSHVFDLVSLAQRLLPLFELNDEETRCLFLGILVHDINKLEPYSDFAKYANAASPENIAEELESLHVEQFWAEWRDYLDDIVLIAHLHQAIATGTESVIDQRRYDSGKLSSRRKKGALKHLIQMVDKADNSHNSQYLDPKERKIRRDLLESLNAALQNKAQYRFVSHRLAELRGLFTNVIHKVINEYLVEKYGAIDLMYYPEGVNYLLDNTVSFDWTEQNLRDVAGQVESRLRVILKTRSRRKFTKPFESQTDHCKVNIGFRMLR